MRKALIAGAVATALFAVGAFAASLTVRSEDIASGNDPVVACAPQVDVDFNDPVLTPGTSGVWTVDGATVHFLAADDSVSHGCDAHDARLAIRTSPGGNYAELGGVQAVDSNGVATFAFAPTVDVATITAASVVVDGATLSADLP